MLPPLASADDLAVLVNKTPEDAKVRLALKRASGRFRDAVGYPVTRVEGDTLVLTGNGTDTLFLKGAPVTAIAVAYGGEEIEPDQYDLDPVAGILYAHGVWAARKQYTVTYTHGYEEVPEGIQDAVLEHATTLCLAYAHIQQETAGPQNASYGAAAMVGVTQKWTDAVLAYRLRGRA